MQPMHFEGLSGAINVSIVAFSIVFGVLFILTGVIFCMRIFAGGSEKKNDSASVKPAAPASAKSVTAVPADKAKIVAAITAAIIEFTGGSNFRILSVQPEQSGDFYTSRWKTAGMLALNSNRLNRSWK